MQGLMLKLLNVDAAGERALRVVSYFDELLVHRPDLESVVRATAILADSAAGLQVPGASSPLFFTPEGSSPSPARPPMETASIDIDVADPGDRPAHAWLQRLQGSGDLDNFILERMSIVVATVLERRRSARFTDTPIGFADPALAALLVNGGVSDSDRTRAARLMGLVVPGRVQTIAIGYDGDSPADVEAIREILTKASGKPAYVAVMTNTLILAVIAGFETITTADLSFAQRGALGPIVDISDAPASWAAAQDALRFAALGPTWNRVVRSEELGSLSLLLSLDQQVVARNNDVLAIQRLSQTPGGSDTLRILEHILNAETLRGAARAANFHHSSVQSRLKRIEASLEVDLRSGIGRQRAGQALVLWQLFLR